MDDEKIKKPDHLKDEVWKQHLLWMDVMGKQVEKNFSRHQARVKEDASRSEALESLHDQVMEAPHRTQDLFCTPKH